MRHWMLLVVAVAALLPVVALAQDESCGTPVAGTGGQTFTGNGHALIDIGRLDEGVYIAHGIYTGGQYFNVTLTGRATGQTDFPFLLETAPFDEQTVVRIYETDDYLMEVDTVGPWSVTIEHA